MRYRVKEIYLTIQGEGAQTGRRAVFCRFSGCNLWSGREADRPRAICRFCDTDFLGTDGVGGGVFASAHALAQTVRATWNESPARWEERPFVVCTGGEPLLQMDAPLVEALHQAGLEVAVETNGTVPAPAGLDWVCVSPKAGAKLVLRRGHELKLVHPQDGVDPALFESLDFDHFSLQPMDGPQRQHHTELAAQYCRAHPRWKLSIQTHKLLGIP